MNQQGRWSRRVLIIALGLSLIFSPALALAQEGTPQAAGGDTIHDDVDRGYGAARCDGPHL